MDKGNSIGKVCRLCITICVLFLGFISTDVDAEEETEILKV